MSLNAPVMSHALRAAAVLSLTSLLIPAQAQQLAWARSVGAEGDDVVQSMTVDPAGNMLLAGYFEGTVDFDPGAGEVMRTSNGGSDVYVQKLSGDGELIWAFSVGGPDADYATGISVDPDGNMYVIGAFNGTVDFDPEFAEDELTSAGEYDMFLARFTSDGELSWVHGVGGPGYDEPKSVAVGAMGNVYMLSYFSGTIDADPGVGEIPFTSAGALDMLLQKFDSEGTLEWAQVTGSEGTDFGLSMALDDAENIWITGSFEGTLDFDPLGGEFLLTSAGAWDIFVTKRSPLGELIWAGRMGGLENFDTGYDIAVDADGNAIVVGAFFGTGDFDPGVGEHLLTASSLGSDDVFVQMLSPAGDFLWAVGLGGTDADLAYGVAVAPNGRIDVTGFFSGTADFDPSTAGIFEMTTSSLDNFFDSYVCALGSDGTFIGAWQFGGANSIATQSIARAPDEDALFVAGHFETASDFDPGATVSTLTSNGFRDAFVIRLDAIGTGVTEREVHEALRLFPNPAVDAVSIDVDAERVGEAYTVSDEAGRVVLRGRFTGARTRLAVDALAEGRYEIHVRGGTAMAGSFVVVR